MQRRIKNIERLYLYIPLAYLMIATVGTVSLLFRISPDFRGTLLPYVNVLDNLFHNIYHAPILDLVAIPSIRICPHPYTTLPISTWPGTDSGLYNKNNKTVYKGTADSLKIPFTELRKDWIEIPAQQKKSMKNWGSYQLCAYYGDARSVNFNNSQCSPGYKLCSQGVICVLQTLPCPISSVEFDWDTNGYQLRMKVERNNSKAAIAFIEASVNGLPCLNPTKGHPISRNEKFPLEGKPNTGCDQFGEYKESLHVIDEEPLGQFYKENGLALMYNKELNYEKYLEGSKIVLVSKTKERLAVKPVCAMTGPTLSGINQMIKNFSFEGTIAPSLMAYHLAVLIFGYVMLCFLYFDKENEEREKYIKQQKHVFNAFHFIPYILCILFIAEYSEVPENGSPKVEIIKANLDVLINSQCIISGQYNEVFADLKHTVIGMNDYYFGMSKSMGVLSYSFILIMLLVKGVRGYYRKEIEEFETSFLEARFEMIRGQETVIDPIALNQVQIELSEDVDGEYDEEEVYAAYLQYVQEQRGGGGNQQNYTNEY